MVPGLVDEYRRQFEWRDWQNALASLPPLAGRTVIDLGCGVGDLAAELASRGALVVGLDSNEELVSHATSRRIPNARFQVADLRSPLNPEISADGVWCSFTLAYFVDPSPVLLQWKQMLKPGGWIAITEIDDLFGHQPLSAKSNALLQAYCDEAASAGRYDFRAGGKLREQLKAAGFHVAKSLTLADRELSFDGPAEPAVLEAWRARFDRMRLLRDFLGPDFSIVRDEFLATLAHPGHVSQARVCYCLAFNEEPAQT